MPEPHILLIVVAPAASGSPAPIAACRAGAWPWPAGSTQPIRISSTLSAAIPARSTAAAIARAPSAGAVDVLQIAEKAAHRRARRADDDDGVCRSSWIGSPLESKRPCDAISRGTGAQRRCLSYKGGPIDKERRMGHEFRSAEERRAAIVALTQKETGIDETMIETLIRAFYARVRQDPLLAPIFEAAHFGLGAASRQYVRFLVVADASDGALSRPADGEAYALGRRRPSLRSVARAVRRNGARALPACRCRALHRARATRRGEPRAWRRDANGVLLQKGERYRGEA